MEPTAYYRCLALTPSEDLFEERFYITNRHSWYAEQNLLMWVEKSISGEGWTLCYVPPRATPLQMYHMDTLVEAFEWCYQFYLADYGMQLSSAYPLEKTAPYRQTMVTEKYTVDFQGNNREGWSYTVHDHNGEIIFVRKDFNARYAAREDFYAWELSTLGVPVTRQHMRDRVTRLSDKLYDYFMAEDTTAYFLHDVEGKPRYLLTFRGPLFKHHGSGWFYTKFAHDRLHLNFTSNHTVRSFIKACRRIATDIVWNNYEEDFNI